MSVESIFPDAAAMEQVLATGMEEGLTQAVGQIDDILAEDAVAQVPGGGIVTRVLAGASVSLGGYIAGPNESGYEHLFAWYGAGDLESPSAIIEGARVTHLRFVVRRS